MSQRISARLGSIAQAAGRHRPMSKHLLPNSQGAARRSLCSWVPRSEATGALLRNVSFPAWSGSAPSARQPCELRLLLAGPLVGGEPLLSRSSSSLRARPWALHGRQPRYLGRATALHRTGCSTSPPTKAPAACPCGLAAGRHRSIVAGARQLRHFLAAGNQKKLSGKVGSAPPTLHSLASERRGMEAARSRWTSPSSPPARWHLP